MRFPVPVVLVVLGACSSSGFDAASAPPSGGGDVSFGGAQDIGELRAILDRGEIPGPDTFDANGFFNEHYNAPPPASCGSLLCVTAGMAVGRDWLAGSHQATLQLAVSSTVDPRAYQRLPMNLVVVVDHSGSMASDGRLDKVKVGLHTLIDNLHDDDRLAIVEFDDQVEVAATLGPALDRAALHAIVSRLEPRGATNIFDGLRQGFLLLGDAPPSERQNRVILLSDGNATAGDTSPTHIMQMASDRVQRGVGLTTIGVGNDFDVGLMRGLAEQGAGNFYFLEDPTAASEVFTEEIDTFMQPIALDVRLEAAAGPGYRFDEVVGSQLWAEGTDRGAMQIPAVFVASRTSQGGGQGRRGGGSMIFIHMTPMAGGTGRVASVTLSFRAPGSPERISQTMTLDYGADPGATPEEPYLSAPEMAERFAMYNMFLGIRAATESPDPGCAVAVLQATRAGATAWNVRHEDPDIAADIALVDQYVANLRAHGAGAQHALSACPVAVDPYGDPPVSDPPIDEVDHYPRGYACSAGGASGGLPIALGALAAVGLRRRRPRPEGARARAV
ncbi:MAG TPA: VWA domain-containing protein [Kofleriaceae bacterium]|nr:VWA domain-containing protein [Kofleriaceae bacterium]